jgi:norsolorinic acid ketoreductase
LNTSTSSDNQSKQQNTQNKQVMSATSYLITGASRGIGYELVEQLAKRPNTVVFAAVRDPATASKDLKRTAHEYSNVHIIRLDSATPSDAQEAAQYIDKVAGGLDVVVANAGIAQDWTKVVAVDPAQLHEHFKINAIGPLVLFQAVYPLLLKRPTKKFVTVSSLVGALTDMLAEPETAYGTSKVALNFITKRIHLEHQQDGIIAYPIHPGIVNTDMGKSAAPVFGMEEFPIKPADSARDILTVVDASNAEYSGRFWSYDGTEIRW